MPIHAPHLTFAAARALFTPPVTRVMLDWNLLSTHAPSVEIELLDANALAALHTPWYLNETRTSEVSYDAASALPLTINEVTRHLDALDRSRPQRMAQIAATCTPDAEAWVVPCYAVGARRLLLDGNHRVAASHVHGLNARVLAVVFHGPTDAAVLPDLANFTSFA